MSFAMPKTSPARFLASDGIAERLLLARSYTANGLGDPLSSSQVSQLAGLVRTHVWLIETSARTNFTIDTIARIAEVLGVSLDWLYRGVGRAPTPGSVRAAIARAKRKQKHSRKPSRA
jgi:transcriptional regulator with XRE-family HTH domain